MKVRDAIKLIESDGWKLARTRGSHRQYYHPAKPGTVTIAGRPSMDFDPNADVYTEAARAEMNKYPVFLNQPLPATAPMFPTFQGVSPLGRRLKKPDNSSARL